MPVERWSDTVLVVRLGDDPQFTEDLQSVEDYHAQMPAGTAWSHAVLDFSGVRALNSSNIARLLKLRKLMISNDARLVLCNLPTPVWGTLLVTGLDKIFHFSNDVTTSLATLQMR